MDGPDLNVLNVALAAAPILVLVASILVLKWSAPRAGAVAWLVVAALALLHFGADAEFLAIATSKGLSLSLFVLPIIWTSVMLYNVIDKMDGIRVIGATMTRLVRDPLAQSLVVGWAFSGFMQGIAGFGVPVAVVAPLMVLMGFRPAQAAAIVLVGHAWAVTFGSLGSSYYTIQLVSGIEGEVIGPHMAAMFALPIVATGFAVAHLEGGMKSVRRGAPTIVVMGAAMAGSVWAVAAIGAPQIASIASGLVGCGVGWAVARTWLLPGREPVAAPSADSETAAAPKAGLGFHMAFLPYYLLISLSIISQVPGVKELGASWYWGLDYPTVATALGFEVDAQNDYARIRLLRHPAPLILASLALTYAVYRFKGHWRKGAGGAAARSTYSQCVATSVGVATMVMMALVMTDTGMIFSPFIGVLGTFMTGSNTNSNVMFGALQLETARALNIHDVTVASTQSIGGSLGSSIAPAKVLVGTAIVGLTDRVNEVMRRTIAYCLVIVLLVGIQAWVLTKLFDAE